MKENRKDQTRSEKVAKLMVDQISRELYNHNAYRTFANFYYKLGLCKLSQYYQLRAFEEYNHHSWLFDRLTQSGVEFEYPKVDAIKPGHLITKPEQSFPITVNLEIETTEWINGIVKQCLEEGDYITEQWLKEVMLGEQHEEENISRHIQAITEDDTDWLTKQDTILSYYNNREYATDIQRDIINTEKVDEEDND